MSPKILLVCGFSGSGKSTFLNCLKSGLLAVEIFEHLPSGCREWPIFEADNIQEDAQDIDYFRAMAELTGGVIFHYDIADIRRFPDKSFESDPRLAFLTQVHELHIASLITSKETLKRQYQERVNSRLAEKTTTKRLWGKWGQPLLRKIGRFFSDKPLTRVELYSNESASNQLLLDWENFLDDIAPKTKIDIVPDEKSTASKPIFKIAVQRGDSAA